MQLPPNEIIWDTMLKLWSQSPCKFSAFQFWRTVNALRWLQSKGTADEPSILGFPQSAFATYPRMARFVLEKGVESRDAVTCALGIGVLKLKILATHIVHSLIVPRLPKSRSMYALLSKLCAPLKISKGFLTILS